MMTSELRGFLALVRAPLQQCSRRLQVPVRRIVTKAGPFKPAFPVCALHTHSVGPTATSGGNLSDIHLYLHQMSVQQPAVVAAPTQATTATGSPLQQYLDNHGSSLLEVSEQQYIFHKISNELDISIITDYDTQLVSFTIVVVNTLSHETLTMRLNPANAVTGAAAKRQILIATAPAYQLSSLTVMNAASKSQEHAVSLSNIDKPSLESFLRDTIGFDQQLLDAVSWHQTELQQQWRTSQSSRFVQQPFRYM